MDQIDGIAVLPPGARDRRHQQPNMAASLLPKGELMKRLESGVARFQSKADLTANVFLDDDLCRQAKVIFENPERLKATRDYFKGLAFKLCGIEEKQPRIVIGKSGRALKQVAGCCTVCKKQGGGG